MIWDLTMRFDLGFAHHCYRCFPLHTEHKWSIANHTYQGIERLRRTDYWTHAGFAVTILEKINKLTIIDNNNNKWKGEGSNFTKFGNKCRMAQTLKTLPNFIVLGQMTYEKSVTIFLPTCKFWHLTRTLGPKFTNLENDVGLLAKSKARSINVPHFVLFWQSVHEIFAAKLRWFRWQCDRQTNIQTKKNSKRQVSLYHAHYLLFELDDERKKHYVLVYHPSVSRRSLPPICMTTVAYKDIMSLIINSALLASLETPANRIAFNSWLQRYHIVKWTVQCVK